MNPPFRPSVLIVEDDAEIRESLADLLRDEGYAVDIARDGREGLERAAVSVPSLVLVDLMMPVMSGEEFIEHFREQHRPARIVVMSAANARTDLAQVLGVEAVIRKPFSVDNLLSVLAAP